MSLKSIILLFFLALGFFACRKDPLDPQKVNEVQEPLKPVEKPSATFVFRATANGETLVPETKWYTNSSLDSFTVTKFNYYISNIKLIGANGTVYAEPESYHLIQHVEGNERFTISDLAPGTYTAMEFMIGVDSIRNVSGAQTGALDVANQMFWDWDTGYIFYKLEGEFNTVSKPFRDMYAIHIGGFSGPLSCLRSGRLVFPQALVADGGKSTVRISAAAEEVFDSPEKIGFDDYYPVSDRTFFSLSLNYTNMFSVESVENK